MALEHRRRALKHYSNLVFRWEKWRQPSLDWDHDHCGGCWVRFADPTRFDYKEPVFGEGWLTVCYVEPSSEPEGSFLAEARASGARVVESPKANNYLRAWFCPECFEIGRAEFGFTVDPDHPQWKAAGL